MPRDQRLYMTFPNDIHRHPKLVRLSVEARWAFIEMNGEARLSDNDGVFKAEEALFHWSAAVLEELCGSHPTRPLVTREEDGGYRIRDYAEHQQTRAEREQLTEKRANAGRMGGKARASGKQLLSNSEQSQAEKELEREKEGEKEKINPSSAPVARASMFDVAYEAWPKKVDRKDAAAKWPRAVKEFGGSESDLVEIVKAHGAAYAVHRAKQFTPSLLVWLNKARWDSELPTAEEPKHTAYQTNTEQNLAYLERLRAEEQSAHRFEIEGAA